MPNNYPKNKDGESDQKNVNEQTEQGSMPPLSSHDGLDATSIGADEGFEQSTSDSNTHSKIGPYTIVREIGEGGMGSVYEAEQTHPVKRRVAIKVIKA